MFGLKFWRWGRVKCINIATGYDWLTEPPI